MNHPRYRHGLRKSDEYRIWRHMRTRCENPKTPVFDHYGGRGISVCERWRDFVNFYADMGPRPSSEHTLDRIDPNGNYEPGNCRWATMTEQQRNRTNNRVFTYQGVTAPLSELCEIHGCKYKTVHARIVKGAPLELAMTPGSLPRGNGNSLAETLRRFSIGVD